VKDRPVGLSKEAIVDYLKSAQWSFSRLIGSQLAQSLSLFLSPYPPTFFELASMDVQELVQLFEEACRAAKDNRQDKRKVPGAAAIMMLDPSSDKSASYIAKPLRELFARFHMEECGLDDHARFKKLCQAILDIPKEEFSEAELTVTFAGLPSVYSRRKHQWRPYDPVLEKRSDASAKVVPLASCPTFTSLYAKKMEKACAGALMEEVSK